MDVAVGGAGVAVASAVGGGDVEVGGNKGSGMVGDGTGVVVTAGAATVEEARASVDAAAR